MDWVFYDKLDNCGTEARFVRAEVTAERRLKALRLRHARRGERQAAEDERRVRSSRLSREHDRRAHTARADDVARREPKSDARTVAEMQCSTSRAAELARLHEHLAASVPVEDPLVHPSHASVASHASAGVGTRLDRLHAAGRLKQRVRNYKVQSHIDHYIDRCEPSRRIFLSLRPASRDNPEPPCLGDDALFGQAVTSESDRARHTHARMHWKTAPGVAESRVIEGAQAVMCENAARNSRRHMLAERRHTAPLPKAACCMGGGGTAVPILFGGGVLVGGWAAGESHAGEESRGPAAWGKGVLVHQGGMWREMATGMHPNHPSRRQAWQTHPTRHLEFKEDVQSDHEVASSAARGAEGTAAMPGRVAKQEAQKGFLLSWHIEESE